MFLVSRTGVLLGQETIRDIKADIMSHHSILPSNPQNRDSNSNARRARIVNPCVGLDAPSFPRFRILDRERERAYGTRLRYGTLHLISPPESSDIYGKHLIAILFLPLPLEKNEGNRRARLKGRMGQRWKRRPRPRAFQISSLRRQREDRWDQTKGEKRAWSWKVGGKDEINSRVYGALKIVGISLTTWQTATVVVLLAGGLKMH